MKNLTQNGLTRVQNTPVQFPKTVRPDARGLMTSARAGITKPAAFIPLMPEDSVQGSVNFTVKMEETVRMLANAVGVRAHVYFVSLAALPRFDGMDSVAAAWSQKVGAPDIIEKHIAGTDARRDFYDAIGEHIPAGDAVNSLYLEAFNTVINYRRQQVSISLPLRNIQEGKSARSLWGQTAISRIVPDFDQALEQAEVQLQYSGALLPLTGRAPVVGWTHGFDSENVSRQINSYGQDVAGTAPDAIRGINLLGSPPTKATRENFRADLSKVRAELSGAAGTISIAQINAAKATQAFAKMRQSFAGNDDDLIDLFMRGFSFPSAAYRDPMLIGSTGTNFGMQQRYATDAANLDTYVANGVANLSVPINLPSQSTGGVIVVTYEIVPEPVYDRQSDMFLRANFDKLPNALRDTLDTQQVDVVPNRYVDALHTAPNQTFGYAPLNYEWSRIRTGVGGRYMRKLGADPSDEDQQNVWSVRVVDPVLNEDTFLCPPNLSHNVFADTLSDPFILQISHNCAIRGITQFGPSLYESKGDYDAVASIVPTDLINP